MGVLLALSLGLPRIANDSVEDFGIFRIVFFGSSQGY
jgi:hypothetical protein